MKKCTIKGCINPLKYGKKGWCTTHYERWRKHGDPLGGRCFFPRNSGGTDEDRFWFYVDKTEDCWLWTANTTKDGYGQFSLNGKIVKAHRYCYELLVGPIPEALQLDHRVECPTRCVRPDHLRLATQKQNNENRRRETKTRSGVRGVTWHTRDEKWQANVRHNDHLYFLGYHDTIDSAEAAVVAKRLELFTHNDIDREVHVDRPTVVT